MTVVFPITISMVSTIVSRFQYYSPIKEQLNSKGFFYDFAYALNPETGGATMRTNDDLCEFIEDEQELIASYDPWIFYGDGNDSKSMSYDDKLINAYTPGIESGKWFDTSKEKSDVVQVVVSQNPYGFKVGEPFQYTQMRHLHCHQ